MQKSKVRTAERSHCEGAPTATSLRSAFPQVPSDGSQKRSNLPVASGQAPRLRQSSAFTQLFLRVLVFYFFLPGISFAGPADSIVAVVGETIILEGELQQALDFVRIAGADTALPDSVLRAQLLEQLINNELLQEQAKKDTIEVTRQQVTAEVDVSIQALRDRFEDEDQFRAALAAEGVTERMLRRRYEDDVRRRLLSRKLMEKQGVTKAYISPAEAERFYEANRDSIARVPGMVTLAHILFAITPSPKAESAGQRRAAEVLDILSRGGDFAIVAGSFSEDRKTSGRGGNWGWNDLRDLPLDLAMVLDQLEPGQMSPPFRSLEGYVMTKLESRSGDRVRFRTILLRVRLGRADTLRALAKAKSVREKALEGLAFDSLAHRFSQDPITADSGGFLGEFLIDGLTSPFDSVVADLDSGDVSGPVLSEHGYHLVKILGKQPERVMGYLEMQDMIRNYLYQEKFSQRLSEYLARIAEKVYIKRAPQRGRL